MSTKEVTVRGRKGKSLFFYHNRGIYIDLAFQVSLSGIRYRGEGLNILVVSHTGSHVKPLGVGFLRSVENVTLAEGYEVPLGHHLLADILHSLLGDGHVDVYGVPDNKSVIDSEHLGVFNHQVEYLSLTSIFHNFSREP